MSSAPSDSRARVSPADAPSTASPLPEGQLLESGRRVIEIESQAVANLLGRVDQSFEQACQLILDARGRVVVLGMGKSGHVGRKIAATLASTGTSAFFVHPAEASHGDLGMISGADVVIGISNSGETEELVSIVPSLKRLGVALIAMTGNPHSQLARAADVHIDVGVEKEACTLNLAPTASTTATLAMGDAIAIALLEARGFTAEDFAYSHPGGSLGRRLLLRIADIMHTGEELPRCPAHLKLVDALIIMTSSRLGMLIVCSEDDQVLGVFTDGDLRRVVETADDIRTLSMESVMTPGGLSVRPAQLAAEALHLMELRKVSALPVVDDDGRLVGAFNMHDLLRAGVY